MKGLIKGCKGKNCVLFGANSTIGTGISEFLSRSGVNLGLIDLDSYKFSTLVERVENPSVKVVYKTVSSGNGDSFKRAVGELDSDLGNIDYLICTYYLEEARKKIEPDDLSVDAWDKLLEEWVLSYFLVAKEVVPRMIQRKAGKVIFINTTTGYTGEGEGEGGLTEGGSIHECACSSAITGMMTSIARDIIPKGVSVNGISLGPNYEDDMERVIWAINLWLSGICEYACARILRLY